MKAGQPLFLLLSLSLVLLIPRLTQAFWKISIKKPNLETKILSQLDTFTSITTKSLEELNKSVYAMVKQRRQSICCYEELIEEDEQSLSLRSAIYTAIVALSRLQDTTSQYRRQLNQNCSKCDIQPGEVQCIAEDYSCPSEPEKCIKPFQMCDGKMDCNDGSDENLEICSKNFKYHCGRDVVCEANQLCIPSSYRCDRRWDCPNGSDEKECYIPHDKQCPDDTFRCVSDDKCVPAIWRCDGEEDCSDGSDEVSCTTTTPITTAAVPDKCPDDNFRCVSDGSCVPAEWRCDGAEECRDGSDEASCPTTTPTTTPSVPSTDCGTHKMRCISSGDCIPGSFRCDGTKDCLDGSDEKNCPKVRGEPCEENPCSHKCVPARWTDLGFYCTCPEGMELQLPDGYNCVATGLKGIKGGISGTKGIKG